MSKAGWLTFRTRRLSPAGPMVGVILIGRAKRDSKDDDSGVFALYSPNFLGILGGRDATRFSALMRGALLNCSKVVFAVVAIFFLYFSPLSCSATSVLYVVTPEGIVIGADGRPLKVPNAPDGKPVCVLSTYKPLIKRKIILLKHRFALASVGLSGADSKDGSTTLYDFPTWARSLKRKMNRNTTLEELSETVEGESSKVLGFAASDLSDWFCKPTGPFAAANDTLTELVIAGFEAGGPVIYSVKFRTDWDKNTAQPVRALVKPWEGQQIDSRIGGFGVAASIFYVFHPKLMPENYKKVFSKFPSEFQALQIDISL